MKKVLALVIVFMSASVFFAGCNPGTKESMETYPWQVIMVMKYTLSSETINAGAVGGIETFLDKEMEKVNGHAELHKSGKVLQIQLHFNTYRAFLNYNGFNNSESVRVVTFKMEETLFFFNRTQTFENPWLVLERNDKMQRVNAINGEVEKWVGISAITKVEHVFVFASSFRRTDVTGNYKMERDFSNYFYFFRGNSNAESEKVPENIVLFDRFANQPIWYVIGLGVTLIFGVGLYFGLRAGKKKV